MYAAAELLFYATLLYLCVRFKYDAVAPLAVGRREEVVEEEGGGWNPSRFLQRENATFSEPVPAEHLHVFLGRRSTLLHENARSEIEIWRRGSEA